MAITGLKIWQAGETFTAQDYVYERDLIVSEINTHTNNTSNPHSVTAAQVGAYTTSQTDSAIASAVGAVETDLTAHIDDTDNPHSVTKAQVGLSNVDNTSDLNKPISTAVQTALNLKVNSSILGQANGVATLDGDGKVPSSQLPSYVDDVLEYNDLASFPATGTSGIIYVAKDTNKTYRWSGSAYVVISETLALGETSSTAYRGDRGKTAYDHSQLTSGNPHQVTLTDLSVTATATELNTLDGITSTTAELNKLDGFTGTFEDLNFAKDLRATGVTTAEFDILDGLTATTAELNILDGVTATASEINTLDGFLGTYEDLNYAKDLRATEVTATEFDYLDGVTSNIQTQINGKEDAFTKNTGFNLNLGTTAGTVAEGNHTHDDRYYTETELNAGQLDTRYYTETELNPLELGQPDFTETSVLDARFYNKDVLDDGALDDRYYTETEVDNALLTKVDKNISGYTEVTEFSDTDTYYVYQNGEKKVNLANLKAYLTSELTGITFQLVDAGLDGLPDVANPLPNTIYLIPSGNEGNDVYFEYLWLGTSWEYLGSTDVDLTNYYTKTQTDGLVQIAKQIHYYPNTKNTSGSTIPKGTVVQFAGSQGDFITIKAAVASEVNDAPQTLMGLAENDILDDAFGNVVWFGQVTDMLIDPNVYNNGDILYFDTTTGGLTKTEPATNKIIVAAVEKVSSTDTATNGILLVRPKWISRDIDEVDGLQAELDTIGNHIDDTTIHFTQSAISITESQISDFGSYEPANANIQAHISATDNPHSVTAAQVGLGNVLNYTVASQLEAEAGTANDKYMTPLRTAQAIVELAPAPDLSTVGQLTGQSTAIGFEALNVDDGTNNYNTAVGYQALTSNTTGSNNEAVGYQALTSNTTGNYNTANGFYALRSNTTGNTNTANGYAALYLTTTGSQNTANGFETLYSNTTGANNTANGYQALRSNTTGTNNTAYGRDALRSNTEGGANTANGLETLRSNTTGSYNTANGFYALRDNTTGNYNTANGNNAGRFIANGSTANTTGDYNTFIGASTKALADNDQNETVIGYNAIGKGSNTVQLGNTSVTQAWVGSNPIVQSATTNHTKIWTGTQAAYDAIGTKDANTLYFIT